MSLEKALLAPSRMGEENKKNKKNKKKNGIELYDNLKQSLSTSIQRLFVFFPFFFIGMNVERIKGDRNIVPSFNFLARKKLQKNY